MRNIDLDSLEIFKAVADLGGITKAAEHLNRVQSNITTRIKNLEERLGVQLFQRHRGRLTLSTEGRTLLTYAERLLLLASEAEAALKSGTPGGTLRIGTLESTAASRLPKLLARYHVRYPDVRIELVTGASTALVNSVHRCEIEAAFVSEPFNHSGLATQLAFAEELVLIMPKELGVIDDLRDIGSQTVIAFETGCSYRRILEDLLTEMRIVPHRVLELASYHAVVACVAAGSGIAIVPRAVLAVVHVENLIHVMSLPEQFTRTSTHLVWLPGHRSVALEALKNEL